MSCLFFIMDAEKVFGFILILKYSVYFNLVVHYNVK